MRPFSASQMFLFSRSICNLAPRFDIVFSLLSLKLLASLHPASCRHETLDNDCLGTRPKLAVSGSYSFVFPLGGSCSVVMVKASTRCRSLDAPSPSTRHMPCNCRVQIRAQPALRLAGVETASAQLPKRPSPLAQMGSSWNSIPIRIKRFAMDQAACHCRRLNPYSQT